jgi:hypothetical protein
MKIGRNVVVMDGVMFDPAYPWLIEIEDDCRVAKDVRIIAHDAAPFQDLGVTRLGRVRLLKGTFVGEAAIILPGVTIGPRAMVAAGSVVSRDFGEGVLVAGNPARVYGQYDEYLARTRDACSGGRVFTLADVESGRQSPEDILASMDRGQTVFVRDAIPGSPYRLNVTDAEVHSRAYEAFQRHFGTSPAERPQQLAEPYRESDSPEKS